jgi:hypothetical protein
VLALEVLEHLEDPAAAAAEMRRVSKRAVVITVPLEPFFRGGNLARGRYVGRLGSTPGHLNMVVGVQLMSLGLIAELIVHFRRDRQPDVLADSDR